MTAAYIIDTAGREELAEILAVQRVAFYQQALLYHNFRIRPLCITLEDMEAGFSSFTYLAARQDGRIIGAGRISTADDTGYIGNVIVLPEFQRQGIGRSLMQDLEAVHPSLTRFELFTGRESTSTIRLYQSLGYSIFKETPAGTHEPALVYMQKFR